MFRGNRSQRASAPAFGASSFNSAQLNENQWETTHFGVLSVQTSANGLDAQLSYFTRYNNLHFLPDPVGDLLLNGIASTSPAPPTPTASRATASYQLNSAHTLRAGFTVSGEQVFVGNTSLVEPCMICDGTDSGSAEVDHRQRLEARHADGGLCSGRVEADQPVDHQRRPALRPDVSVHQRQPVQPSVERHL